MYVLSQPCVTSKTNKKSRETIVMHGLLTGYKLMNNFCAQCFKHGSEINNVHIMYVSGAMLHGWATTGLPLPKYLPPVGRPREGPRGKTDARGNHGADEPGRVRSQS